MKPALKRIYSENNDFQHVEVLKRNREKRAQYRQFFIEGVKSINSAIEYGWKIDTFIYSPFSDKSAEIPLSKWAQDVLNNPHTNAHLHLEIPFELMQKLSDKDEEYSEILAVASMPDNDLSRIPVKDDMLVVVFDRPSSPGNLGTLIRTCEAMKVDGVIITGHAADMYDPKTIRASMGTFFALPVIRAESHQELLAWFDSIRSKFGDFRLIGSSAQSETVIDNVRLARPMALFLGNEASGLSHNFKNICDVLVKIPMYGKISSFNVACAASVMLYEIDRQNRQA